MLSNSGKRMMSSKINNCQDNPFDVDAINAHVLGYMPESEFLFYAPVCKTWSEEWKESSRDTVTDVQTGDLSVAQIKEVLDYGSETVTMSMLETVAKTGDFHLIKKMCLRHDGKIRDGNVLTAAVSSGNIDMVKWLFHDQGCSTVFNSLDEASRRGDIDMYCWLRGHDATRCWKTISNAATMGHLDMLKHIHSDIEDEKDYGFGISEYDEAISCAIYYKQVGVVKWLQNVGVSV
ncbi:unnamed protein product [Pylaiella littoralis]